MFNGGVKAQNREKERRDSESSEGGANFQVGAINGGGRVDFQVSMTSFHVNITYPLLTLINFPKNDARKYARETFKIYLSKSHSFSNPIKISNLAPRKAARNVQ